MTLFPQDFADAILFDDCPHEDLTTVGLGIGSVPGRITAAFKTPGIVAGAEIAAAVLSRAGASVCLRARDGDMLQAGYKMAQCVMEYASGIASRTRAMVDAARAVNPKIQVAGTRKHWPGGKRIALAGLLAGGGIVHRFGLSDSILVFDQHRVFCGDFEAAFKTLQARSPERKVAVEAGSPQEAMHFVRLGADIIQCERFSPEDFASFADAARAESPRVVLSAAGGVNAGNAALYAEAGADILVTSAPYWGAPQDVKMRFERL